MKYIYSEGNIIKMDAIDGFEVDFIRVPLKNKKLTELVGIVAVKYFGAETKDEILEKEFAESKRKFLITPYIEPDKFDPHSLKNFIEVINEMPDGGVVECFYDEDNILQIQEW